MSSPSRIVLSCMLLLLCTATVDAEPIDGSVSISGGFFPVGSSITGDISLSGNTISVDPTAILGNQYDTIVSELLPPGTYTRTHNLSAGGTITRTATIPAGTQGAYFVVRLNNDTEHQIFNAWDVSPDGKVFTNVPIPGDVWIGGIYDGRRAIYNFEIVPPFSNIGIDIVSSYNYECTEVGGSTITIDANVTLEGVAVLDRVDWVVDGVLVGQGSSLTRFYTLGSHVVEATAVATDGNTATDMVGVTVADTIAPNLNIVFTDSGGNVVASAVDGEYTVTLNSSDVCDVSPAVSASASKVMSIVSGDKVTVNQLDGSVILPTTAVSVSARASDASGNSISKSAILAIE